MIPFDAIHPGDTVIFTDGSTGTVVSLWHCVEFRGTPLERERPRLVVDLGWMTCPADYHPDIIARIERNGAPLNDGPVQMGLWK